MLEARIIEPVDDFEWVIHMVFQEKKHGGMRICIDIQKLNDSSYMALFLPLSHMSY
jgi:hypothetical protein